ncbi:GLPGLI family protein [Flavobacterium rakeshii]|uniref:GLPGLI family protein n=1 Tax=Flavobacterium rakeshii TaxID=1038845 RepID=A0A6N8HI53_9FLAO|nr:GLPGLI family protein [Flavobacterium rakeshii]MEE1899147.1 GLPGLI family protein [Flavobacterium rakeshii]MUV05444.1 GLPGLI family protein [Flavobacterium rakeshii]
MKIPVFIYSVLICLISNTIYSQAYQVVYNYSIIDTKDEYGIIGFGKEKLITSEIESLSFSRNIDTVAVIKGIEEPHVQEASEYSASIYKEFMKGLRYCPTFFNYDLKDHDYSIEWEIGESTKNILGYNCQSAIGNYRGRNYIVFFTTDIPVQNGPHTFDNLPGLILEISSSDNVVHFLAESIKQVDEKIYNPFTKREYIDWEQFKILYKKYFERMTNYKPEEDMTVIVPNRGIEIYLDEK